MAKKSKISKKGIREAIFNAGIVGAGGAGFPTHIKYSADAEIVIANGVECEPLLYHDKHLMEDRPNAVIQGMRLAMKATGAKRGVIAIKKKYRKAAEALQAAIPKKNSISLFYMEDYYPAGDEQEITRAVTGQVVPPGGIPLQVGAVVSNVTTLAQVADALQGVVVTHRLLSLVGDFPNPVTVPVPLGMSVEELLESTDNVVPPDVVIISGGLMMGELVSLNDVVMKTTTALVAIPAQHPRIREFTQSLTHLKQRALSACCQCQACTDICPRALLGHPLSPHQNMRSMANTGVIPDSALLCCECGLCTYLVACPMGLSPRRVNQELKKARMQDGKSSRPQWKLTEERMIRSFRRISSSRLKAKLAIEQYDVEPQRLPPLRARKSLKIPLKQHIGKAANCAVTVGMKVKEGQLLAKGLSLTDIAAQIHSPVDGSVEAIDRYSITIAPKS